MPGNATGSFEVKVTPQASDTGDHSGLSRMSLDKQFHGDLEANSQGTMLASAATVVKGSGGYVAMERVTGKLKDRKGSFVLQHTGTMTRGVPHMLVTVVPDSGTDELTGLAGTMTSKSNLANTPMNSITRCPQPHKGALLQSRG